MYKVCSIFSQATASRSDRWPNGRKSLAFNWLFQRLRESAVQGFWKAGVPRCGSIRNRNSVWCAPCGILKAATSSGSRPSMQWCWSLSPMESMVPGFVRHTMVTA